MNQTKYRVQNKLNLLSIIIENQGIKLSDLLKYTSYKTVNQLKQELDKLFMVGSYPYTPADYIEIDYKDDDSVEVFLPNNVDKTIGLNVEEWTSILKILTNEIKNPRPLEENKKIYKSIIEKLKPIIPFTDYFANEEAREIIEEAIKNSKKIKFNYLGWKNKQVEEKIVNPSLIFYADQDYLSAFYDSINEHRFFRISNISKLEILNESIPKEILENIPNEQIEKFNQFVINSSQNSPEAELLIHESIEFNLSRHLEIETISIEKDWKKIKTKILEENWFMNTIKSFGSKIIIISPTSLKEKFLVDLKNIQPIKIIE